MKGMPMEGLRLWQLGAVALGVVGCITLERFLLLGERRVGAVRAVQRVCCATAYGRPLLAFPIYCCVSQGVPQVPVSEPLQSQGLVQAAIAVFWRGN